MPKPTSKKPTTPPTLDNLTIAKLAIAIATAQQLTERGEVTGPLTRKVIEELNSIDALPWLGNYL